MGYVDDAFANLKRTNEVSPTAEGAASRRQQAIREVVRTGWDLDDDFLTGSYRRETKIKPLQDVDMFVVVDPDGTQGSYRSKTPGDILAALRGVLEAKYDSVTIDRMACTVGFGSESEIVSFDVVPAFKLASGGYGIPDSQRGVWIKTNPKLHHELSTAKNSRCDHKFVPFVKMVKAINRDLGGPVMPSFLIEVMAWQFVTEPFGRYQDEVRWFLASAVEGVDRVWPDPASLGPDVNTMSSAQRANAAKALRGALAVAEEAIRLEDDGQERAAVEAWRRLFGNRMPRP